MSLNVTFNGSVFIIPETGEVGWGGNTTSYLVAIAAGALQKTGGSFTLSAETDFGASFGLKSLYYKSRSANIAAAGILRLNNNSDSINWRNAANSADLSLTVNASDQILFNGVPLAGSTVTANRALVSNGSGVISAATTTATEIGYVNLVTSPIQTQLDSKVSLTGNQTIAGIKTFSSLTNFTDIAFPSTYGVSRMYNVKDFGAIGDGVTDDTLAIQACITAAEAAYYGGVYFPLGTYRITDTLRIKKTIALIGESGTMLGADSDYSTDAGNPTLYTGGVVIRQNGTDKDGLLVRQDPISTYRIVFRMENILWVGQLDNAGAGPAGTTGDGIKIDPQDVGLGVQCIFRNVAISWFRGYGLNLVQGYYGSSFYDMSINGCQLTGFRAVGTSQGEYTVVNLRAFGNGTQGATEVDQCGVYVNSGGGGISFYHVSATTNYRVQMMIEGSGVLLEDLWTESFPTNHADDRCLVWKGATPCVVNAGFTPPSGFLGKIIDIRSTASNGYLIGLKFSDTVAASGYHIFEDGTSGSNEYQITGVNGTFYSSISADSTLGNGNARNQQILTNISATRSVKIQSTTPATTTRIWTIPDISSDGTFAALEGSQVFSGSKSFTSPILATDGTVSLPSYSFSSDPDTGLFRSGANAMKLVTNGAPILEMDANFLYPIVQLQSGNGTASDPTYSFFSDPDTGMYRAATNDLRLVTNGAAKIQIDGNYFYPLVQTQAIDGTISAPAYSFFTDPDSGMYRIGTDSIGLGTNSINAITISSAQAVSIRGTATNDSASTGYVGEYIESVVSAVAVPTTSQWGDLTSISLTAGDWDVSASAQMTTPGTQTGEFRLGISTTSGNSATGLVIGSNRLTWFPATSGSDASGVIPVYRMSLASTTTVYFKMFDEYSAGTPQLSGRLSARRVR